VDKKSIIGFFLITLLLFIWLIYNQWKVSQRGPTEVPVQPQTVIDTSEQAPMLPPEREEITPSAAELPISGLIIPDTLGEEKTVEVETELYTAVFSSRGGVLKSFTLKKYKRWDTAFVQLIPPGLAQSPLNLIFPDSNLNLERLNFRTDRDQLILDRSRSRGKIVFTLTTLSGAHIVKTYSFLNGRYDLKLEFEIDGLTQLDLGRKYLLGWGSGLNSTEKDRKSDLDKFAAYSKMGEEFSDYKKFHQPKGEEVGVLQEAGSGNTKWVATRTKYFVAALAPLSRDASGFSASGTRSLSFKAGEEIQTKRIGVFLEMPLERTASLKDSFMVYVGPLDYFVLKGYGMGWDRIVDLSGSIIRPFSIAVLWLFVHLHKIIPNYGLVIILFTILMKVAFHPLTKKSTTATMRMQALQPKLAQLKEKYKKDPTRLNQETMKLYKQAGVNPLGGCLPLLFQMPVFWALFVVFRSTIELRGAKFIFWLTDLSLKDPYYVLPILMGVAMFWQQKLTIKDPKQAMLVYLMPIFFFFIFRNFPAGLTLYWTVFNVLSLIEAYYFKHKGLHPSSLAQQPAKEK
jgi:YidC/Oxa1 family membrane protein insertase